MDVINAVPLSRHLPVILHLKRIFLLAGVRPNAMYLPEKGAYIPVRFILLPLDIAHSVDESPFSLSLFHFRSDSDYNEINV